MKPYYDTGLKALAQASGYPLPAIQTCSQFNRTHQFILEVWESLYRVMILQYTKVNPSNLLQEITRQVLSIPTKNFLFEFNNHLLSNKDVLRSRFEGFHLFVQKMTSTDETWRFWAQFVFEDVMAYISLFVAIRSGNWDLRVGSIKSMAAKQPLITLHTKS